jgi:hypothetical protein
VGEEDGPHEVGDGRVDLERRHREREHEARDARPLAQLGPRAGDERGERRERRARGDRHRLGGRGRAREASHGDVAKGCGDRIERDPAHEHEPAEHDDVVRDRPDDAKPELGPHVGREGEHPDRRRPQHPLHDDEHGVADGREEGGDRRPALGGEAGNGDGEQQGEHDEGQHRPVGGRLHRVDRHEPDDEAAKRGQLTFGDVARGGVGAESGSRGWVEWHAVHQRRRGEGRDDRDAGQQREEDDDRARAEPAEGPEVDEGGHAGDEQRDDERDEGHADRVHPEGAERLEERHERAQRGEARGQEAEAQTGGEGDECENGWRRRPACGEERRGHGLRWVTVGEVAGGGPILRRGRDRCRGWWRGLSFGMNSRVFLLLAGLWVTGACGSITDPPLPGGARVVPAPELYARWWAMTESCSGITGSLDAVTWYEVPDVSSIPLNGREVGAYWSLASNRIVVAGNAALDGGLVRHEMLHALTQSSGHARQLYLGSCAGVVACDAGCVADAGAPPAADPASVSVPPESLTVTVEVASDALLETRQGQYFAVRVTVHNRATRSVVAELPVAGQADRRLGFAYDVRGPTGAWKVGIPALDPSWWTFAAGERKQQLFDVYSGSDLGVERFPGGDYLVRGSYGGHSSGTLTLQLGP